MNHIIKAKEEKQKLEKKLNECVWKEILPLDVNHVFNVKQACHKCDGYKTECVQYKPRRNYMPEQIVKEYIERIRKYQ